MAELGDDAVEQQRVDTFAVDLARWLVGEREGLSALVRVVTLVAGRELATASVLCHHRPLLAIEAAARAVNALWPLLRTSWEPPAPDAPDETEGVDQWLAEVGQPDSDDPELRALGRMMGESGDGDAVQSAASTGRELAKAANAAEDGALDSQRVADQLDRWLPGMSWSGAPAPLRPELHDQLDELARILARIPEMDELADALGRSQGPPEDDGGLEEVAGVHLSGDISSALPAELALLADPETEDLFYQRLIEHRLLSLQLQGEGVQGAQGRQRRGPVIACIDTSGSMRGVPERIAKALVLAVCRRVLPQGRTIHLLLFSGPTDRTELRLRPGQGGLERLLDFLMQGFGGGTDFDAPLLRAIDLLDERALERADILVVTDGLARADEHVIDSVEVCRRATGVGVVSVVIGRDTAGVAPFSDSIHTIDPRRVVPPDAPIRRTRESP